MRRSVTSASGERLDVSVDGEALQALLDRDIAGQQGQGPPAAALMLL